MKQNIVVMIVSMVALIMSGCFGNIESYQPLSKVKAEKILSKGEK